MWPRRCIKIEGLLPKGHFFSVAYEIKVCYLLVLYMPLIYAARAEASGLAVAHGPLSPPPYPLASDSPWFVRAVASRAL